MGTGMKQRRGTAAEWAAATRVMEDGEIGLDKDTGTVKIGDGVNLWANLTRKFITFATLIKTFPQRLAGTSTVAAPLTYLNPLDFGAVGDGVADDTAAWEALIAAMPIKGARVSLDGRIFRLVRSLTVVGKPIVIDGLGPGQNPSSIGSILRFENLATGGLILDNCDGSAIRSLAIEGTGMTGGALLDIKGTAGGFYQLHIEHVRISGGHTNLRLRNGFFARFFNCIFKDPTGVASVLLNGSSDADDVQSIEFTNCNIAGDTAGLVDCLVLDGYGASTKFVNCSVLFGKRGLWMKDSYGSAVPVNFTYFLGGGFENQSDTAIQCDVGKRLWMTGAYIATDTLTGKVIEHAATWSGDCMFTGCYVRGGANGGFWLRAGYTTITGCHVVNNNRVSEPSLTVTGVANNGSGLMRVTTSTPHGWATDDLVSITGVVGATTANARWKIAVITATTFDLVLNVDTASPSVFGAAYTSGGAVSRITASIRVLSTATNVVVTGCRLGGTYDGLANTEYAIVNEAVNFTAGLNDCSGVTVAAYAGLANSPRNRVRFNTNDNVYGADGSFSGKVAGAVTTGLKDLNSFYISGYRIRIVRIGHAIGSGTSSGFRLAINGSTTGISLVTATTTPAMSTLTSPIEIDGRTTPQRVQLSVATVTGAPTDLMVDFTYEIID